MKKLANKIQNAFDEIKAQPQLIESTKQYLSKKQKKQTRFHYSRSFQRTCIAACIAFVLAVGFGGYSLFETPVSYVSIDVNPSIELALNRFDCVVSITAYNAQGEEILKDLSLKWKKYLDAIHLIVESKAMGPYLTDASELVLTVAADSSREETLKTGVEGCSDHIGHNTQSVSADIELVPQAHDHGFSVGKYYAYLQLIQYDDTVTLDEGRKMSISQIHGLISEHEHEHGQNHSQSIEQETYTKESENENETTSHHGGHHSGHSHH